MITLLKNVDCYTPAHIGKKDIWIAGEKIYKIVVPNQYDTNHPLVNVISCDGLVALPGMIDGHVHITGGGGEEGFASRIGEINIKDIFQAGITTVVGLLGADNQTKSLKSLLAKANALQQEGLTTFIYSGSYEIPIITLTGDIVRDMVLVDKVIGAGEVAISDHRSSVPGVREMLDLASKTHIGGLISGKAGLIHIHVGDGKSGLEMLKQVLQASDLSMEMFLPTHVNRNPKLLKQAIEYAKQGGNIDLTSGEEAGIPVPEAIEMLLDSGVDMKRVTISSDANGSIPNGGVGEIRTLYTDVVDSILQKGIAPEIVFPLVTENPARRIAQHNAKGALLEGLDADILIMDQSFQVQKLFSLGKLVINNGKVVEE